MKEFIVSLWVLIMKKFMGAKVKDIIAIESLLPEFETHEACLKEKNLRIGKLSRPGEYRRMLLAEILSECDDEEHCFSLACPECLRMLRVRKVSQLAYLCEDYTEWSIATFIYFDEMVRELDYLDINRLKDRLRKQLQRAGVTDIAIGYFEVDYQTEYHHWVPHFHLLVRCKDSYTPEWKRLRNLFQQQVVTSNVNIIKNSPVEFQRLTDPLEQIAYICKFMWQRVESYYGCRGKRKREKFRLPNKKFIDSLLKLDSMKLSDLEFMYGIRQYGATLKESVRGKR